MKVVVPTFNQEKELIGALSVIAKLQTSSSIVTTTMNLTLCWLVVVQFDAGYELQGPGCYDL